MFSRLRRGAGLFTGGRDHLTHRLLGILGTPQNVALALAGAQAALCAVGIVLYDSTIVTVFGVATAYVVLGVGDDRGVRVAVSALGGQGGS